MSLANDAIWVAQLFSYSTLTSFQKYRELAEIEFEKALRSRYADLTDDDFREARDRMAADFDRTSMEWLEERYNGPDSDSEKAKFLGSCWKEFFKEGKRTLGELFDNYIAFDESEPEDDEDGNEEM